MELFLLVAWGFVNLYLYLYIVASACDLDITIPPTFHSVAEICFAILSVGCGYIFFSTQNRYVQRSNRKILNLILLIAS